MKTNFYYLVPKGGLSVRKVEVLQKLEVLHVARYAVMPDQARIIFVFTEQFRKSLLRIKKISR